MESTECFENVGKSSNCGWFERGRHAVATFVRILLTVAIHHHLISLFRRPLGFLPTGSQIPRLERGLHIVMALRRSQRISAQAAAVPAKQEREEKRGKKKTETSINAIRATRAKAKNAASNGGVAKNRAPPRLKAKAKAKAKSDRPVVNGDGNLAKEAAEPVLDRPIEPHQTNVPLVSPQGNSAAVAYPAAAVAATTGNLLEKAEAHLIAADPRMKPLIERRRCPLFTPEGLAEPVNPWESLASSIISQQVSGAAAKSIKQKFVRLFFPETTDGTNGQEKKEGATPFPTPEIVAKTDLSTLRTAGLSQRKAEYIQSLAAKFASGELTTEKLLTASDEEIMEMLIAVRGLGKWSVEMFSCFTLKRTDVFSTGDLGVQFVPFLLPSFPGPIVSPSLIGGHLLTKLGVDVRILSDAMCLNSRLKAESSSTCRRRKCWRWRRSSGPIGW